jgi:vacuole morphology and inheritance protein 14
MEVTNQLISPQIQRNLCDKLYEKRKVAALEIEKAVRELVVHKDHPKITLLIAFLVKDFSYSQQSHSRNGGLIALAATAIALGPLVHLHLKQIVPPIFTAFQDTDSRVRYYACESMYNVGKVARGNILVWFNEIFDALTKLSVDVELSVKNGAELLDRLIKDIVTEKASFYTEELDKAGSEIEGDGDPLSESVKVPGTTRIKGG